MRLPSHQYDPKDLLRNMSVALDGPEEVIEGDDYLQPTSSITELPEENTTPISNGKVRTLFHSLPEEDITPISNGKVRTLFHSLPEENITPISNRKVRTLFYALPAVNKLHHGTTRGEHHIDQQQKGMYTVPLTTCNRQALIKRTLLISNGKVRTLFHLADKLHYRTTHEHRSSE